MLLCEGELGWRECDLAMIERSDICIAIAIV
jgi:hypothetical protein